LKSHAQAFESLLALTPARDYFGSHAVDGRDPSEQWNRKKQSKDEKRAAKKAKLDPANQKSALDVLKEKEAEALRKRKRKSDADEEDEGLEGGKRMKRDEDADAAEARRREKAEKKKEKRERKKEWKAAKRAKAEAKKLKKQESDVNDVEAERQRPEAVEDDSESNAEHVEPSEMEAVDFSGLADADGSHDDDEDMEDAASASSSAPTTPLDSPAFDLATNHSVASSSSSIVPPSVVSKPLKSRAKHSELAPVPTTANSVQDKPADTYQADPPSGASSPRANKPKISHAEAQERLRARIEELRAKRKADGPHGQPARSRTELLEERRRSDEKRKQAKKEQRAKEKEEEARRREEMLRGSGSPLGSVAGSIDMFSPRSPQPTNYSFSRLAFQDGTAATADLTDLRNAGRKKGPSDPATALQAAQAKQSRLSGYDAGKRADIAEKDSWLKARKKAQGERIRDDTSLLKKALKRKEKQKSKSETQWKEREENVVKGREIKQKKREANLAKRREEKGGKGKKKNKGGAGKGKKVKRPGFEGRFRA
jgi:hypothetical protein